MLALLVLFLTPLPREIGALIIAALLLANRKITSRTMIAAVDWPLLLLFVCLFADHRRAQRYRDRRQGAGLSRQSPPAAEQSRAADPVQRRHQQRDRQCAGGDAAAADLADAAAGRALWAGAAVDARRQSAAHRQPDQPADRRARRADGGGAHLSRPMPAPGCRSRSCRWPSRRSGWPRTESCRGRRRRHRRRCRKLGWQGGRGQRVLLFCGAPLA